MAILLVSKIQKTDIGTLREDSILSSNIRKKYDVVGEETKRHIKLYSNYNKSQNIVSY